VEVNTLKEGVKAMLKVKMEITDPSGDVQDVTYDVMDGTIAFSQKQHSALSVMLNNSGNKYSWLKLGLKVKVYSDSSSPPTTPIFSGYVEDVHFYKTGGTEVVTFIAIHDSFRHFKTIVRERYADKTASEIVGDLFAKYCPNVTTHITTTTTTYSEIIFPYLQLGSCIKTLCDSEDFIAYFDGNGEFWFKPRIPYDDSGIDLTDDNLLSQIQRKESLQGVYSKVTVLGGTKRLLESSVETASSYVTSDEKSYAFFFKLSKSERLYIVSLYLEKIGSPGNLAIKIVEDVGGLPSDSIAVQDEYRSEDVGSANWYELYFEQDLLYGKDYWLVIEQVGDSSNHYRIYHDGSTTGSHAEKNGTWAIVTDSFNICHKIYSGAPIIVELSDDTFLDEYGFHLEMPPVKKPELVDYDVAKLYAEKLLSAVKEPKVYYDNVKTLDIDVVPLPWQTVDIATTQFTDTVVVESITLRIVGDTVYDVNMKLGSLPPTSYEELAELDRRLSAEESVTSGIFTREPILDLVAVSQDLNISEEVLVSEELNWQFQWDVSKWGRMEWT